MAGIWIAAAVACAATAALLLILDRCAAPTFLVAAITPRSNHAHRPRQLGGLGLSAAWLVAAAAVGLAGGVSGGAAGWIGAAIALLVVVGFLDDVRHRPALFRLAVHAAAAALALSAFPRLIPDLGPVLPSASGTVLAMLVLVASINIVNFMDGLDLMSVAGAGIPLAFAAMALSGQGDAGMIALLAAGAAGGLLAFAGFNRPPARMFLGDSGSLPLGLVCGLAILALHDLHGGLAGLVPFAYYAVDSLSTLALRAARLQPFWQAHSQHAYQKAYRAGLSAWRISGLVALLSLACGLGLLSAEPAGIWAGWYLPVAATLLAAVLTLHFRLAAPGRAKT
ncbi:UDP-N-acetylmuramyl pentapeptide phosphotransferase/UDP-N-acetylglucosamine-1-phosphate transferase [Hoeflea marina]|uniref:UDP-N-acetylmuramyl pentapeptide phosphotransferase/UDP-N-acetylglucosamine-1-phosphate transferase n=1 Tax=Hoeflea marina TaxID=274592 RepID=A0A317PMB9_9HYPH|nr:hypothetical protein [Hoeflea marina]PWW01907.1 UDP-N-acetylmuramyl pentapeptide phosphotransferase/UDP-N-acetylglucosamine-1-phosphate transferase [Hoeflea marina]